MQERRGKYDIHLADQPVQASTFEAAWLGEHIPGEERGLKSVPVAEEIVAEVYEARLEIEAGELRGRDPLADEVAQLLGKAASGI